MTVFLKKGFTTSCLTCKCHFLRVWGPFPSAGSRGRLGKKALNWVFSLCQGSLSFARGEGFDFEHPLVMSRLPRASFLTQWFSRALTLGWHCSCIFCSAAHLVQMLFRKYRNHPQYPCVPQERRRYFLCAVIFAIFVSIPA